MEFFNTENSKIKFITYFEFTQKISTKKTVKFIFFVKEQTERGREVNGGKKGGKVSMINCNKAREK